MNEYMPEFKPAVPGRLILEGVKGRSDIQTLDGRTLEWYNNTQITKGVMSLTIFRNAIETDLYLEELGILEAPETPAINAFGEEEPSCVAYYVDARIGKSGVKGVTAWLDENSAYFARLDTDGSPEDIRAEVDKALEATGLGEKVAAMREQDSQNPQDVPELDLNEIMRTMRGRLK